MSTTAKGTDVTTGTFEPKVRRDFQREFVVAYGYNTGVNRFRTLAGTSDDAELEINLELYERMERDSAIAKSKKILITSVLADDLQLAPGATEEEVGPDEYQLYLWVQEFCERMILGLDRPYRETAEQILGNAIRYGHGLAETEWDYRMDGPSTKPTPKVEPPVVVPDKPKQGMMSKFWASLGFSTVDTVDDGPEDPGVKRPTLKGQKMRLMPTGIKVKPRGSARFVIDDFFNVLGLAPANRLFRPGGEAQLKWDEIIDRDKFLVLTLNREDEDPRGKSMYRPAVTWYNLKGEVPEEMLRFILQESVPQAVGTLPEQFTPFEQEVDDNGDLVWNDPDTKKDPVMLSAAESMARQIENFRSGSGAVIPYGAKLEPYKKGLTGSNDAELFNKVLAIINREMENAILLQILAQSEGEHQARSASEQVANILHNLVFWIRWLLATMTLTDLFAVGVKNNLGDWALKYLPQVSFGDFVRRDWANDLEVLADAYFKGFIDDSQRAELMAWMNLPKPGPSRQELGLQAVAQQDVNGEPAQPNTNRPDKKAGSKDRNANNGTEKKSNGKPKATGNGPKHVLVHAAGKFRGTARRISLGRFTR
jgi:hypothetical protein